MCLGGGPKGYPVKALVGNSYPECLENVLSWNQLGRENIDYYGILTPGNKCRIGDTVIFGFRSQVFITRVHVCLGIRWILTVKVGVLWLKQILNTLTILIMML